MKITGALLEQPEYSFLKEDPHLGKNLLLLGLGGSFAYGTNQEGSDIDLRGIAMPSRSDLLGFGSFQQLVDEGTDTTVYAFGRITKLLMECNPNTIELLGLLPEHYLILTEIGRELLRRKSLFLSKRAIQSFGGYADAQLRRLENALARERLPQAKKEEHILNSLKNMIYSFNARYQSFENGSFRIYIDEADNPDLDRELYVDVSLQRYPLRDYRNIWSDLSSVVRDYDRLGKRNRKKDDQKLNKHAMHLIRLFMMAIDILEKGEIITYREKEHDLLMEIRSGGYQNSDGSFKDSFFRLVSSYEKQLHRAAENTKLPDQPDREAIEAFVMSVHERAVRGEF